MRRSLVWIMVVAIVVVVASVGVDRANSYPNPFLVATSLSPPSASTMTETCAMVAITISPVTDLTATCYAIIVGVAVNCNPTTSNSDVVMGIGAPRKTFIAGTSSFSCVVVYNLGTSISVAVLSNGDGDSFSNRMGMIYRDGLIASTLSQTDMQAWMMGAPRKFVSTANLVLDPAAIRDDTYRGDARIATETARSARDLIQHRDGIIWQSANANQSASIDQANSPPAAIIESNTVAIRPTRTNLRWV